MDSKEGIEQVTPVDAQAVGLLDTSLSRSGTEDATMANLPRKVGGPVGSPTAPEGNPRWESYCLYIRMLRDSDVVLEQDHKVPDYCWNAGICKDICEARTRVLLGTFSVDLLSDTEFLVYKLPKMGQGLSEAESMLFADFIGGSYLWAGVPADVFITPQTIQQARRDKAKTRQYRRRITVEWLAATQARLKDLDLAAQKCWELKENPVGRGWGMIRWADKYLAQQHGRELPQAMGLGLTLSVFPDRTVTPDDYLSVREPSEFEFNSKETDPEESEDDPEEDDASVSSDSTYKSSRHNTDRTCRTNIINRNHRRNQRKRKEHRGRRPTNAKREEDRRKGKVVLLLFRDSLKEGTLTYMDWRQKVEEYLRKGYDDNRVKDAMLSSVEGQAYVNFRSCDEGRNHTPAQILKEMDSIYNVSVTFRDLNARMCGLKQGMNEPIKSYYKRMADISVKLEQYHGDRFGPGELSLMKKDCFYARLKEHNKYLVSHMKDRDQYGPAQMLKEIWEQEDSRYLANTSPKPQNQDTHNKNTNHYGGKGPSYEKTWAYAIRHTDMHLPNPEPDEPDSPPVPESEVGEVYDEGYYVAVIAMADETEWWGRFFNCGTEGHRWAECTEPLKDSLKWVKEWANRKRQSLNRHGGVGAKGAWPPKTGTAKAD